MNYRRGVRRYLINATQQVSRINQKRWLLLLRFLVSLNWKHIINDNRHRERRNGPSCTDFFLHRSAKKKTGLHTNADLPPCAQRRVANNKINSGAKRCNVGSALFDRSDLDTEIFSKHPSGMCRIKIVHCSNKPPPMANIYSLSAREHNAIKSRRARIKTSTEMLI